MQLLATPQDVSSVPQLTKLDVGYVNLLIRSADQCIRNFVKRKILDKQTITRYHSGRNQQRIVLQERPVWEITNLWEDSNGAFGQSSNPFPSGTLLRSGIDYVLEIDDDGEISNRGTVLRYGPGFTNYWSFQTYRGGKLAGRRLPIWTLGDGNLKVEYVAGYDPIPADLTVACITLIAWFVRNLPLGSVLQSESLGAYSYSIMTTNLQGNPDLGTIRRTLASYRETTF